MQKFGCKIVRDFQRPQKELIEKFKDIPVANIDDCMSRTAAVDGAIKPFNGAKLCKKGLPVTVKAAREYVNDIAGVRVVCNYIDDVYRVAEMLELQKDVEIIKRQDYIKTPNYNGYRSLHLDIRVPIYFSDRTEYVLAEIQIRTIAMDFWASLVHDIRYKADKSKLPAGINEEMYECAAYGAGYAVCRICTKG